MVRDRDDRADRSLVLDDDVRPEAVGDEGIELGSDESEFCGESTGGEVGTPAPDVIEEVEQVDSVRWWPIEDFLDATQRNHVSM